MRGAIVLLGLAATSLAVPLTGRASSSSCTYACPGTDVVGDKLLSGVLSAASILQCTYISGLKTSICTYSSTTGARTGTVGNCPATATCTATSSGSSSSISSSSTQASSSASSSSATSASSAAPTSSITAITSTSTSATPTSTAISSSSITSTPSTSVTSSAPQSSSTSISLPISVPTSLPVSIPTSTASASSSAAPTSSSTPTVLSSATSASSTSTVSTSSSTSISLPVSVPTSLPITLPTTSDPLTVDPSTSVSISTSSSSSASSSSPSDSSSLSLPVTLPTSLPVTLTSTSSSSSASSIDSSTEISSASSVTASSSLSLPVSIPTSLPITLPTSSSPTSTSTSSSATPSSTLPGGWTMAYGCAVDTASRVLASPEYYQLTNNTPAVCTAKCTERGFTIAGVEYGYECFCAQGYVDGVPPQSAPSSECDIPCSGDASQTCGGGYRLQIYDAPAAYIDVATLPSGWAQTMPCGVDTIDRIFTNTTSLTLANNTPARCIEQCSELGFTMAGVEYSDECYCGSSYRDGTPPPVAPDTQCQYACAGAPDLTCGGSWGIQVYENL